MPWGTGMMNSFIIMELDSLKPGRPEKVAEREGSLPAVLIARKTACLKCQDTWTLSLADDLWHQFVILETPYFSAHLGCKRPVDLVEGDSLFFNMLEAGDSPIAASSWGRQESGGVSGCLHGEENGRHH